MIKRFVAEIDYLEALAHMYEAHGDREVSRSALRAARSLKRLMADVIEAKRNPERSQAGSRRHLKAA